MTMQLDVVDYRWLKVGEIAIAFPLLERKRERLEVKWNPACVTPFRKTLPLVPAYYRERASIRAKEVVEPHAED